MREKEGERECWTEREHIYRVLALHQQFFANYGCSIVAGWPRELGHEDERERERERQTHTERNRGKETDTVSSEIEKSSGARHVSQSSTSSRLQLLLPCVKLHLPEANHAAPKVVS